MSLPQRSCAIVTRADQGLLAALRDQARLLGIDSDFQSIKARQDIAGEDQILLAISCAWLSRLVELAPLGSGDRGLGKADLDLVWRATLSCPTLGEAITRAGDLCRMVGPRACLLELTVARGTAAVTMATLRPKTLAGALNDIYGLASLMAMFSWLIGETLPLAVTEIAHALPPPDAVTVHLFPAGLREGTTNVARFPAAFLERPLIRVGRELEAKLRYHPYDLLLPNDNDVLLAPRVAALFRAALAIGARMPTIDLLAQRFHMSSATFRRRLLAEGSSINRIKEACRRELALSGLAEANGNLADVAYRAGFADPSAFRRAFKSWTGVTPGRFRAQTTASAPLDARGGKRA